MERHNPSVKTVCRFATLLMRHLYSVLSLTYISSELVLTPAVFLLARPPPNLPLRPCFCMAARLFPYKKLFSPVFAPPKFPDSPIFGAAPPVFFAAHPTPTSSKPIPKIPAPTSPQLPDLYRFQDLFENPPYLAPKNLFSVVRTTPLTMA